MSPIIVTIIIVGGIFIAAGVACAYFRYRNRTKSAKSTGYSRLSTEPPAYDFI